MTQTVTTQLDDEDQLSQALAEIRADRASEDAAPVVEPAAAEVTLEAPAPAVDATPAAPEQQAEQQPATVDPVKAAQAELHRLQSEIGRVNALNAKYMAASQELASLREELTQLKAQPQKPVENAQTADRLAQVAEQVKDFPELAGIVAAVSDALKQADQKTEEVARRVAAQVVEPLEPLRREQTSRIQSEQQAAHDAALATFNSTYPNAVDVVRSADFTQWLASQPQHIKFAFEKGQTPQEAMSVLDTYDMHLRRSGKQTIAQIQSQPNAQPAAATRAAPDTTRLQRAAGIPSRPAGGQGGQPPSDDFDAALAYFRTKRLNANRANA